MAVTLKQLQPANRQQKCDRAVATTGYTNIY